MNTMALLDELEKTVRTLDPDQCRRKEIAAQATAYTENFLEALPTQPGFLTGPIDILSDQRIEEAGKPLQALLDILENEVDKVGINTTSGRHLGFIPGGGIWVSAIADLLAATTNRYAGIAYSNPGAVKIEKQLIEWMASLLGYPAGAYGNLTSGGSIANLIAIKAARDHHGINSQNVRQVVVYISAQTHHCVHKALHITGLHESVTRTIPVNDRFQMDTGQLRQQMLADQKAGLRPFLVIASAGTTDTGAVDELDIIADLCAEFGAWFHVDAAYGGFFIMLKEMQPIFKGIERSDSVVLDPHKTLFIPYGSGAVLLRDRQILLASNTYHASYMKDADGMEDLNPADTGIELTRHNRGLRMWLPLQLHGTLPFQAALREKILLCRYFRYQIAKLGFETGPEPDLSVCIFRYPGDENNAINQQLLAAIHADGRVYLSSTTIKGKMWIRCAVVSHRTHQAEIDLALQMIQENLQILVETSATTAVAQN